MQNPTDSAPVVERDEQSRPVPPRRHHFGLALIAVFKLVKGSLLLGSLGSMTGVGSADEPMAVFSLT